MTNHYRHNYVGHTLNNKDILAIPVEAIANTAHTLGPFHKKAVNNSAIFFSFPFVTHTNKDF